MKRRELITHIVQQGAVLLREGAYIAYIREVGTELKFRGIRKSLMSWPGESVEIWIYRLSRNANEGGGEVEFRGVVKKTDDWWIGWLADLPGVNAQERTREELLESLKIGAEDMLTTPLDLEQEAELVTVKVG